MESGSVRLGGAVQCIGAAAAEAVPEVLTCSSASPGVTTAARAPEHTRGASWRHRRFNLTVYRRSELLFRVYASQDFMTAFARVG